jgi:glycosyltransferase involved in cell wall biosynthesis
MENSQINIQHESVPRISVIVPVYNTERFIADAIKSILAQTYRSFELIVVDDGSTDQTREIILSFPSVKYLYQANSGVASARNRGVKTSCGEFLAFLDADDLWMPDKLSLQMAAFEADPTLEIVSGHVEQFVDTDMDPNLAQKYALYTAPLQGYVPVAMLIKRRAFEAIGIFHESFQTAETISWVAGIVDKNLKVLILPDVVARRRIHGKNISMLNRKENNHNIIRALKFSIDRKRAR